MGNVIKDFSSSKKDSKVDKETQSTKTFKLNILLSSHSITEPDAIRIINYLREQNFNVYIITEKEPDKLSIRSKLVQICDAFLVITSRSYQKSVECMELINYAKDLKKQIYSVNISDSYLPFGGLGAISAGTTLGLVNLSNDDIYKQNLEKIIDHLKKNEESKTVNDDENLFETLSSSTVEEIDLDFSDEETDVVVSYEIVSEEIAGILREALEKESIRFICEKIDSEKTYINSAKLLIVVMSKEYEDSDRARAIVETARKLNKRIIPVSTNKAWKPKDWLGLVIAGKLFYRILDKEQAYKQKYDSTPMNDLIYAIKIALSPSQDHDQVEIKIIDSFKEQIEECKNKLDHWPPKKRSRYLHERKPVQVTLSEPKADHEFNFIHYTLTRINFEAPKQLFDRNGTPIRQKFDCMISYQWDYQNLVREIYYDLSMSNLSIWFDIWGGMQGNSNEAMATAIQFSKVILIFLSDSYQKSVNCQLEFKYAVMCGKPLVFIVVQNDLEISDWVEPYYNISPKFEVNSIEDLGIEYNGVPRIRCISQAIRETGMAQSDPEDFELNEEILCLRNELNDALDEIAEKSGSNRFKICTRCDKQYDQMNTFGCKRHTAYYIDGTLIEGRWVCCSQQGKHAIGCSDAEHIDFVRELMVDENYGTLSWIPE